MFKHCYKIHFRNSENRGFITLKRKAKNENIKQKELEKN